ncbi:unnamed protein product [Rhizophagus irregularis]|nr:unnamed protein product [Rhizophagus irregularis]
MTSISKKQCSKCYQHFDTNFFTSKTGRDLKTCINCREQAATVYRTHHLNDKDQLEQLYWNDVKKKLYDKIVEIGSNEYLENKENGVLFSCILIMENELLKEEPCNISKQVAKLVEQADGYYYIYKDHYLSKKSDGIYTYWYYCSQCQQLAKKPRKNEDLNKQRDREYIKRFDCNGLITISINMNTFLVTIHLKHDILHKRPERYAVSDTIKEKIKQYINFTPKDIFRQLEQENPDLTQKQVHAWWANFIKQEYIRDKNNQLKSAKLLLEEYNYEIILVNIEGEINYLGFITPFFELLSTNKEIVVDATLIGQSDGAGFALAYLLLDSTKKNDGIRTEILVEFFNQLRIRGLNYLQFFLTDKDFAQITAAQSTWNNIKIQLCLWHIKKALKKKLSDNTYPKTTTYSSYDAHETFDFIDIEFYPVISNQKEKNFIFCPKDLRPKIIELLETHLHRHPLIPNCAGEFLSKEDIWKLSVQEIYEFCFKYDLRYVWAYLWINWYQKKMWILWSRAAIEDQIYTTRWICSCLSFARNRFFICKHLVQQYGRPESFYDVHRQERYPFIFFNTMETTSESDIVLIENDNIQKGILQDVTNIEDDDKNETDKIFDEYEEWLNGTLEIIRKQRTFGNYRWAKAIRNSLEGVHKLYSDVKTYQNRHTNPRTWKDFNKHTMFLE